MRRSQRDERRRDPAGFTLVELLVVIAIIGLIISLILVAAADGVRRAEERATQSLIIKLETGLNDRLDALSSTQAPVNQTHRYLAAINYKSGSNFLPITGLPGSSGSIERRAQVIAQYDYIRAELPDVFFLNASTSDGASFASHYPLNFAGSPYPNNTTLPYTQYYLPLGNLAPGLPLDSNSNLVPASLLPDNSPITTPIYNPPPISGIFGASFSAAASVYKNLYAAAAEDVYADYAARKPPVSAPVINPGPAYDGVDNNGDGYIDDLTEVVVSLASAKATFSAAVTARLAKHTHKTARAEMLYAILVEGLGPLGSVFTSDEFTNREVKDTDGDGLPEFVDAWGEPILFFRWPIYFGTVAGSSDSQKGSNAYASYPDTRQLDPLDPNQLLVSPGWWSTAGNPGLTSSSKFAPTFGAPNGTASTESQGALGFMHYFGSLVDPYGSDKSGNSWDRTGLYDRRAYFSKFLVLSSGPDREPGVGQFGKDYTALTDDGSGNPVALFPNPSLTVVQNVSALVLIENQASQSDPSFAKTLSTPGRTGIFYEIPNFSTSTSQYLRNNAGLDDISNHNTSAPSTGVR